MIMLAALASVALIIAATEVVAHGLARVPGLGATLTPHFSVIKGPGAAALVFGR